MEVPSYAVSVLEPQVATFTCDGWRKTICKWRCLTCAIPGRATSCCTHAVMAGGEPSVNGGCPSPVLYQCRATSCYFYMRWLEESHLCKWRCPSPVLYQVEPQVATFTCDGWRRAICKWKLPHLNNCYL